MRAAIALTGDPALALHYGESTDISEYSVVGLIGRASATMAPEPTHAAEYRRVLGAPVVFGARRNAILADPEILAEPVQRLPAYAFGVLTKHADVLLDSLARTATVRSQVERLLMPMLHTGPVRIDTVAARLNVSRQTLYRRLKAEGVTFAQVLDDLRRRMALDYLTTRKVSVTETAYLVGFSEPAAFSRAFKRWTGRRPRVS
jgi:AraC-like DNA-binding protein